MNKSINKFMHVCSAFIGVVLYLFLFGCSSSIIGGVSKKEALQNIKWSYDKAAIELTINTSETLNLYNNEAHSIALTIVQFSDPNDFLLYDQDANKTARLLLDGNDAKGWLSVKQIFLNPGENKTLLLDRAQKAQYIGVVAGYNDLVSEKVARFYRLGIEYDSSGIIVKKYEAKPAPLQIQLSLGESGIIDTKTHDQIPKKIVKEPKAGVMPMTTHPKNRLIKSKL